MSVNIIARHDATTTYTVYKTVPPATVYTDRALAMTI